MKKELPKGWEWVKFDDICEIISGKNQSKVINPIGKYPIYGSSGIFGFADEYLCEAGTTIIGRKGTINKPLFVNTRFWNVDTAFGLSTNESYNNKLLFYFCLCFNFQKLDKSTTIPSLAKRDLLTIDIPLPPLPTQKAIVSKIEELFSELDKGIENLKTAQAQLKVYRQSVLKWAFEGKLTNGLNHDSLDLSDVNDLAMVAEPQEVYQSKKNQGNQEYPKNHGADKEGLPVGWKWKFLKDITNNFDGKRRPVSRLLRATRKGEYRYFGATEVVDYIDDYLFDGKYILIGEDGANLLSKSKPLAFIAEGKFWVNNHAHVLQTKENYSTKYFCYYFNSLNIAEFVTGTAQPKLNQANLNKIKIPCCPTIEQIQIVQEIESRLSVADKMEETIQQSLLQAESLRQSILKKAFEGELVK